MDCPNQKGTLGDLDDGLLFLKEAGGRVIASLAGKVPSWSCVGADLELDVQRAMYEEALTPNIMDMLYLVCIVSGTFVLK